jgi:tRNA (cytidine/uridine-2'-O-)-methyltransferase
MNNVGQDNQVSAGSLIVASNRFSERLHRSYLVTVRPCYTARPMFDVILYQPEIPPNTGNIIRLCANTGARLHLVKPLGFSLEDKQLLRAGLDYHEFATITIHESWAECIERFKERRLFAVSTKGAQQYDLAEYEKGDVFLFGPESRGLPAEILGAVAEQQRIRVPMVPGNRSLNLSNTVAVVLYEAWRQVGFETRT